MGLWRIVKDTQQPIHDSLVNRSVDYYPYTINYVIKRRDQIDSYYDLPEEKRPPRSIWDRPYEVKDWFERVFDKKKQTEFNLPVDEGEID
jgi:hypothetical protein